MKLDFSLLAEVFSPRIVQRAVASFDRASVVIVSASWGAAVVILALALYTINLSVTAKREVAAAAASEPALPAINARPPEAREMKPIVERLQKRFPEISFSLAGDQSLSVTAQDGGQFRSWLTVLSYIDTISPQYRWKIKDLCVGIQCSTTTPMRALLQAEKVTFTVPSPAG